MILLDQKLIDRLRFALDGEDLPEEAAIVNAALGRYSGRSDYLDSSVDLTDLDISEANTDEQNVLIALDYFGLAR